MHLRFPDPAAPAPGTPAAGPAPTPLVARVLAVVLAVAALAAVVTVADAAARSEAAGAQTPVALTAEEHAHVTLINEHRTARGLPALSVDAAAQRDARAWAVELARQGGLSHDADLRGACMRADAGCRAWAENVGYSSSHEKAFAAFAASAPHDHNMRMAGSGGVPVRVGVAVLRSGSRVYVVHRFYRCTCGDAALAESQARQLRESRAFATALYRDFLAQDASAGAVDALATPVLYGIDRRAVADAFARSDVWVGGMVDRFYVSTLGRTAEPSGRRHWIGVIRDGRAPAEVAAYLFASDEYYARTGGTPSAWVTDLFRGILARQPRSDEHAYWSGSVEQGTPRASVSVGVYQSAESRRGRVAELYRQLLGRGPDAGGWNYWTAQLADGHDVRLAVELAGSAEYLVRAVQRFG